MEKNNDLESLNIPFKVKIFETMTTWLLCICAITGSLVFYKLYDLFLKYSKNYNNSFDFVNIVLRFEQYKKDLKQIATLFYIYKIFILISIVVFCLFIIFRIIKKEKYKLLKFSNLICSLFIIYSLYLIYLTKDLMIAIKSINMSTYTESFQDAIYLLYKMQNIKDLRYVIATVFLFVLVITIIALVANIYEMLKKTDVVLHERINVAFKIIMILPFFFLLFANYKIVTNSNKISVKDYFVLGYDVDANNNIQYVPYLNLKKIENRYIDPYTRSFLKQGLSYEIDKKEAKAGDNVAINASYDLEKAKELDLKIRDLKFYVKNDKTPKLLTDTKFNINSLYSYMEKYDTRYIKESKYKKDDDYSGIYFDKDSKEFISIQKIELDYVPINDKKMIDQNREFVYAIVYLGKVFVDEKGMVLGYTALNTNGLVMYEYNEDNLKAIQKYNIKMSEGNVK